MAFKVFLSSGMDPGEQVTVLRLQTLAAAHGISVLVPHRNGTGGKPLSRKVQNAINQSDCVLTIITSRVGEAVQEELKYALSRKKLVIPIIQTGVAEPSFLKKFPRVFHFSDGYPNNVENEVIKFLKEQQVSSEKQKAIGALVLLGLGLFFLVALAKE